MKFALKVLMAIFVLSALCTGVWWAANLPDGMLQVFLSVFGVLLSVAAVYFFGWLLWENEED